jgi:hypothetical protein
MRSPIELAVAFLTVLGGRPRTSPTPDPDSSTISVEDAVEASLGEVAAKPLFGVGVESPFEYVFTYSRFHGTVDPALEMVRTQLDLQHGEVLEASELDDAGSSDPWPLTDPGSRA